MFLSDLHTKIFVHLSLPPQFEDSGIVRPTVLLVFVVWKEEKIDWQNKNGKKKIYLARLDTYCMIHFTEVLLCV